MPHHCQRAAPVPGADPSERTGGAASRATLALRALARERALRSRVLVRLSPQLAAPRPPPRDPAHAPRELRGGEPLRRRTLSHDSQPAVTRMRFGETDPRYPACARAGAAVTQPSWPRFSSRPEGFVLFTGDQSPARRDSRRIAVRARRSWRKRAQSARIASETNSPGSSGSAGDDVASGSGPDFTPHPRCGNCGKLACGTADVPLGSCVARSGDLTRSAAFGDHSNGGRSLNLRRERKLSRRLRSGTVAASPALLSANRRGHVCWAKHRVDAPAGPLCRGSRASRGRTCVAPLGCTGSALSVPSSPASRGSGKGRVERKLA